MKEKVRKIKPWQDRNANPLGDEELRIVSASWPQETWEAYLTSLETNERETITGKYEKILLHYDCGKAIEEFYSLFETGSTNASERFANWDISLALSSLTNRERLVIKQVFFQEKNSSEAAREMGISRQAAGRALTRALRKLKTKLLSQ